jgi:hypothetical protein
VVESGLKMDLQYECPVIPSLYAAIFVYVPEPRPYDCMVKAARCSLFSSGGLARGNRLHFTTVATCFQFMREW